MNPRPMQVLWSLPVAFLLSSCASSDNPVALSELNAVGTLALPPGELLTFEENELHVAITSGGSALEMERVWLEITAPAGGEPRIVDLTEGSGGFSGEIQFLEPGGHHIHMMGIPHRHRLAAELGEQEVDVRRQFQMIGPYLVELEVDPPLLEPHSLVHLHLYAWLLDGGGTITGPAEGLTLAVEAHDPLAEETVLSVIEESPGLYEAEYRLGEAGLYELHVALDVGGTIEEGEFHLPVHAAEEPAPTDGGGHTHD